MPKLIRRIFKYSWRFILCIIAFVIIYLATEFCLSRITIQKELADSSAVAIYIKTNGVHTDIVMPVKNGLQDWSSSILFSNTHLQDSTQVKWLAMGWGDKGFYLETPTWADLKFTTAFKAAFALSNCAIHATYYNDIKESKSCKKIMLSNAQYARLVNYCNNSFTHQNSGAIIPVNTTANYNDADAFYEANGHYSMLKTCNTWANAALKAGGQKACLWTAFDTGIFRKYQQTTDESH